MSNGVCAAPDYGDLSAPERMSRPAELTPLTTLRVASLMREMGFPRGGVNVVPDYGAAPGQHLAAHPCGSTDVAPGAAPTVTLPRGTPPLSQR